MENILDLTPLHIVVESNARSTLHRLQLAGTWKDSQPKTRHTAFSKDGELDAITSMCCDKMQLYFVFKRLFNIHLPTRKQWKQELKSDKNSLTWYTDGSKMSSGSGAGIYAKDFQVYQSMGKYTTVFQAEVYAIISCAQENLDRGANGKTIYILSDSQAALKALTACRIESRLVLNAIEVLNRLGRHNTIRLVWVPGHVGVEGNEKADELAREGSANSFDGPEPFVGLSQSTVKIALKEYAQKLHCEEWVSTKQLQHSKKFLGSSQLCRIKHIYTMSRSQTRYVLGAFTGHFATRKHLCRLGRLRDNMCRMCGEQEESMEHLLCECDALARRRLTVLGWAYPKPEQYRLLRLNLIAKLLKSVFDEMEEE